MKKSIFQVELQYDEKYGGKIKYDIWRSMDNLVCRKVRCEEKLEKKQG